MFGLIMDRLLFQDRIGTNHKLFVCLERRTKYLSNVWPLFAVRKVRRRRKIREILWLWNFYRDMDWLFADQSKRDLIPVWVDRNNQSKYPQHSSMANRLKSSASGWSKPNFYSGLELLLRDFAVLTLSNCLIDRPDDWYYVVDSTFLWITGPSSQKGNPTLDRSLMYCAWSERRLRVAHSRKKDRHLPSLNPSDNTRGLIHIQEKELFSFVHFVWVEWRRSIYWFPFINRRWPRKEIGIVLTNVLYIPESIVDDPQRESPNRVCSRPLVEWLLAKQWCKFFLPRVMITWNVDNVWNRN